VGINVRWMGELRYYVKTPYIRRFLLSEMIARTLRHYVTDRLRRAQIDGKP